MEKIIRNELNTESNNKEELLLGIMCKAYEKAHGSDFIIDSVSCDNNFLSEREQDFLDEIIKDMMDKDYPLYKLGMKVDNFMEKNSRAKTGSFYTPELLSRGIVKITLSDYFKYKNSTLYQFFREFDTSRDYDPLLLKEAFDELCHLKVIDLSCGSGIFLISFLNIIIDVYTKLKSSEKDMELSDYDLKNIYGFDIQSAPIDILKLSLMDLSKRYDFIHGDVSNIRVGNSLFEEIYTRFDMVLGNPPYIGEKGNRSIFLDMKKTDFGKKYYEGKMDYFYYFIYKGFEILKNSGVLGYITTNYFITADGASGLRLFLSKNSRFETLVNFNDIILFSSAPGQHNLVFTLTQNPSIQSIDDCSQQGELKGTRISVISKNDSFEPEQFCEIVQSKAYILDYNKVFNERNKIALTESDDYHSILDKVISTSNMTLGDFISVKQGIVSGADKVSKMMIDKKLSEKTMKTYDIKKDNPIFVFDLGQDADIEDDLLKPFYKNSDVYRYKVNRNTDKKIIYIDQSIDSFETIYPSAYNHLIKYKSVLDLRREVKNGTKPWYCLQWGREKELFEEARIVAPQRSIKNCFGYGVKQFYASADVYYLKLEEDFGIDLEELNYYLLGILNSKLYYFWLYNMGKRKGNLLELYSKPLSEIPLILDVKSDFFCEITQLVGNIMSEIDDIYDVQQSIDSLIYKRFKLNALEISQVENLYKSMLSKIRS